MNRLVLKTISVLAVISVLTVSVSFAQKKGFYVPDVPANELTQYIGQRIKFSEKSSFGGRDHNTYVFYNKCGGKYETIYTIKSVKGDKNYKVELQDEEGSTIIIRIGHSGTDFKSLYDMTGFYFIDKYESERKQYIGEVISNSEGQPVAKIIDVELPINSTTPSSFVVKSDFDGSTVKVKNLDYANQLCKSFGIILTHPLVKSKYKVVGTPVSSYNGNKYTKCSVQNMDDPTDIRTSTFADLDNFFDEDTKIHYKSHLVKVEKPKNPAIRYGKTTVQSENNVSKYSYVDNVIDILIFGGEKEFDFVLKNVSDNSIKVIWNEAVFVGYDGSSSKIMHVGTKYSQRDGDQPPTTIIKGAKIDDCAIPNCNVKLINSDWVVMSMFPQTQKTEPIQIRLMLPIQIKDVINEYVFVFEANWLYDHPERLNLD